MPENNPNQYVLTGKAVSIIYGPDLQGQTTVHFTIENFPPRTANKREFRETEIDQVGTMISFAIKSGPDADEGDPQFSFLLPTVTLDGAAPHQFETIGLKSITTRLGPAHQRYTYVALHGEAQFVQT